MHGKLKIKSNIYYKYNNLKNDYHRLCHEYKFYNEKDTLFYKIVLNNNNSAESDFDNNIFYVKDEFYVEFKDNYNKIKMILFLHRNNIQGFGSFNLQHINDNFTNIAYLDRSDISLKIDKNENDISTNLMGINTNEDNIAYNLEEINSIKNNISKSYLKNIYNILFYDKKTQIDFRNLFYEKVFDVNSKQNDFIEMDFKISLEYENISQRVYVKTIYENLDENDNSLYIKFASNNKYAYFSNRLFIYENIFIILLRMLKKYNLLLNFKW